MKNKSSLCLLNYVAFVFGLFAFALSFIFILKLQLLIGLILLLICLSLITLRVNVTIDMEIFSVIICNKILFKSYNKKTYRVKKEAGKIVMINSKNEVFGINSKPNIFFSYDVLYQSNNSHKTVIYAATNETQAYKIAIFLSTNLNIELECKTINNSEN